MSNEIHTIMFDKGKTVLEMRFDGDNFQTATVKFELKNTLGIITGVCMAIPVRSLFDITQLIEVSIREKTARTEELIEDMKILKDKENKRDKKN